MVVEIEISSALHTMVPVSGKNLARDQWDIPGGSRVEEVLDMLSLTEVPTLLVLKGHVVTEERTLEDGDTLKIFPVISGG